jgi:hypothetical protein
MDSFRRSRTNRRDRIRVHAALLSIVRRDRGSPSLAQVALPGLKTLSVPVSLENGRAQPSRVLFSDSRR